MIAVTEEAVAGEEWYLLAKPFLKRIIKNTENRSEADITTNKMGILNKYHFSKNCITSLVACGLVILSNSAHAESVDKGNLSPDASHLATNSVNQAFQRLSSETTASTLDSLNSLPKAFNEDFLFIGSDFNEPLDRLLSSQNNQLFSNKARTNKGQWSVSFDVKQLSPLATDFNLSTSEQSNVDKPLGWQLGSKYVSSDKTSQFYVNYGDKKVPISISFDSSQADILEQQRYGAGLKQELNENWAVTIEYLKADNQLAERKTFAGGENPLAYNYSFDFNQENQVGLVNFSPWAAGNRMPSAFNSEVSEIQIKVSRQLTDNFSLSASASNLNSRAQLDNVLSDLSHLEQQLSAKQLKLESDYQIDHNWSFAANLARKSSDVATLSSLPEKKSDLNHFNTTTLDIGLQYQSRWDQVGVVIRIDLMNLLGVSNLYETTENQGDLERTSESSLLPFGFQTPKYIKLSGSINF